METLLIQALDGFLGLIRQLITNLVGNEAETWGNELKKFLKKEPCWVVEKVKEVVKKTLTSFITIQTGGVTGVALVGEMEAAGIEVSDYAKSMVANEAFVVSEIVGTADLVALSIAELGFTKNPLTTDFMTTDFCARWSAENLQGYAIELCKPEDGLQLRKQWKNQSNGTTVWMAMELIAGSDRERLVFSVECSSDGYRWLNGHWARPDGRWFLGFRIVFRLRKIT